jgi:hypothetical protein
MSEVTQNPAVENQTTTTNAEPQTQIIDKGSYILEQVRFRPGTDLAGLDYYVKQYKTDDEEQAKASLEHIQTVWKSSQIVGILNSAIRSAQRVKAQNTILSIQDGPERKKVYNNRLLQDSCLLKPEEAESWIPGDRELTINGLMREMAKAMKEGRFEDAQKFLAMVNEKMADQLQKAEEAEETANA